MKLSINVSNLFTRYDFEKCVDIYRTAGFEAMDFGLGSLLEPDSPFSAESYREYAENIRKFAESQNMPITQTHAPFRFKPKQFEEEFDEVVLPTLVRSLEVSALLGAEIVVVHPIHYMTYRGHSEEIFERNMAYYRRLLPYCREYGIKVGVENMFQKDPVRKYIVHDTCSVKEEFLRYIDTLDSEYMVACLDVGHVSLPLQDDTAADIIRALGHDRLKSLHIHDNDYCSDQHLLPYMGNLDWAEIAKALGEINYDGDFTYETKAMYLDHCDEGFIPIGAKFMADVGKHIISMINANRPSAEN